MAPIRPLVIMPLKETRLKCVISRNRVKVTIHIWINNKNRIDRIRQPQIFCQATLFLIFGIIHKSIKYAVKYKPTLGLTNISKRYPNKTVSTIYPFGA